MKYPLTAFFLVSFFCLSAQSPVVPHKLQFAGMTLTIRDDARKEIQKDVDALTQSPRHFNMRVERAKTYFPVIEKVFAEEDVPNDFKYLVIQESALIPDAVSVSNAVGFWQFKDYTAVEMGLRVDKEVDERLNIVSSTRAAARYIKRNNMHFDNWLFALQAYQMGAGGVMKNEKDLRHGASHMEITGKTYWYVKKYLAHKIAFENTVNGPGQLSIATYQSRGKQSLKDVAKDVNINEDEILSYNKWLKAKTIPDDKAYAVIIPVVSGVTIDETDAPYLASGKTNSSPSDVRAGANALKTGAQDSKKINGVLAIKARPGETATALAKRAHLELNSFLRHNDMTLRDKVKPGVYYFTAKKRSRGVEPYHKVEAGEDLWIISQQYGVKLNKLRRFNRMRENDVVSQGTMIYLSSTKPRNSATPVVSTEVAKVDEEKEFNWGSESASSVPAGTGGVIVIAEKNSEIPSVVIQDTLVTVPDSVKDVALSENDPDSLTTVESDSVITVKIEEKVELPAQHVVQKGETLYGIARMYNLDVMTIAELNNLNLQESIRTGQVLELKGPEGVTAARTQPVEITYEVKASDTLYSVARKYGVTIKEIMDWNAKSDFNVSVGEKLKIIQKVSD
ncbi:MAG TPA: LysM peptidoglycan-binding domain-containing protein [Cyclobacteriaceae bacterium]|nr:LysM peptidoglycan-binding domain-containing protein [Cyclobacteriaceae bacterium]